MPPPPQAQCSSISEVSASALEAASEPGCTCATVLAQLDSAWLQFSTLRRKLIRVPIVAASSQLDSCSLSLAAPLAAETTVKTIEDAFKEYTNREDIAIVMISQYVSPLA